MQFKEADKIAMEVCYLLQPHCQIIKIGGSLRRQKAQVKDIEIICIPKMKTPKVRDRSWTLAVFNLGKILKGKIGNGKYIKIYHPKGINIDLFVATPENFGMIHLIRTGSTDFCKHILNKLNLKGYTSDGGLVTNKKTGEQISFTKETQVFEFLGMDWVEPHLR